MTSDRIPITITYRKPGAQPPIFVAGSFSDPAWEPQEMEHATDDGGEHVFKKNVLAQEGTSIHYKFRHESGDWALDEDAPTVTDDMGNRNNSMEVVRPEKLVYSPQAGTPSANANSFATGSDGAEHPPHSQPESAQADAESSHLSKPLPMSVLDVMKQEIPVSRSQTSTPGFVRTAAEVADSAALLDKEDVEPEIPDDEAGRLGVRRLTATPIPEVATTAAEVADSAQLLDADEDIVLEVPPPLFAHERMGDSYDAGPAAPDEVHEGAPLFAYELAGSDKPAGTQSGDAPVTEHEASKGLDYDLDSYDLNDPTLERLPDSLEGIYDTVRRVETSLNEDRVEFEAFPPSPVVGPGRRSSNDFAADLLSTSPSASPVVPRAVRRLEIHGVPPGSETPERSASQLSLHSIIEEETGAEDVERSDDDGDGIQLKSSKSTPKNGQASPSGYLTPERATSPAPPDSPSEPTPNVSAPIPVAGPKDARIVESLKTDIRTTIVQENSTALSPKIVVHSAQSTDQDGKLSSVPMPGGATLNEVETDSDTSSTPHAPCTAEGKEPILAETRSDVETSQGGRLGSEEGMREAETLPEEAHPSAEIDTARSTGFSAKHDDSEPNELLKTRGTSQAERAVTPSSIRSTGLDVSRNGNWLTAFFRLIFVDWIGGFIRRFRWGSKA